ncbi:acetyl-coenzyme A synthetase [Sulfodiicoccus acidiphilus]|uniref:Acetate--CoA ligase n=1 Tax=Sulfodiicoccus acidiphilus TaxID=1670455 RepID=A0A348B6M3_9CREN|nr:acetyl-coenzyme A synthetase [Sulfodiicoccus acidiphilus]GGT96471.1 acetyl-coenzyme A synthetase [Sulfodiicoccus acidiphilus]
MLKNWIHRNVDEREYLDYHRKAVKEYQQHWEVIARELEWFSPWTKVVEETDKAHVFKWFVGGTTNISYLALDRHAKTWRRHKLAFIWEGEPVDEQGRPKEVRKFTYYDLWREVNRVAYAMRTKLGLKRGDRIAIYLPMIPELPIFMLAAARLGVIFTVIFSGFTAENIANRVNDLNASLIVTADGVYRRGKILRLKEIVDESLKFTPSVQRVVVVRRLGGELSLTQRDVTLDELLKGVPPNTYVDPERMESNEVLYVLYTSGTTGRPKGMIHDHGGYATLLHATMKWVFDARDDDVYFCTADIGWVTGHSYIVFGPLIEGLTSVMYEGTLDFPAPDRWWSIVERYGVTILYTSPTAVRTLMKFGDDLVKKHDLSTLRIIHSVGEPINPSAWRWLFEVVGGSRAPVGSTWWMTETGGIMISYLPGLMLVPMKPGSNGYPLPGIDVDVLDESGNPVKPGERGYLVIRNPWPGMPAAPTGVWGDHERYVKTYWSKYKDLFYAGDYAVKDSDGYIWVAGRADEVMKVSGHRIGTYELESVLVAHRAVSEAAVIGVPDEVKGEVPIAYVVLKTGNQPSEEMRKELVDWIRKNYGPIATPRALFFVNKLPKTRSGKIMRRLMRSVATNSPLGDTTTLEDASSVEEVRTAYEEFVKSIR